MLADVAPSKPIPRTSWPEPAGLVCISYDTIIAILAARALILVFGATYLLAQTALEQAVTYARQQNYAEADRVLRGVATPEGAPQRIAFYRLKAAVASGLGRAGEAADQMNAALDLSPDNDALILAAAVAEIQAERQDAAIGHLRRLNTNPGAQEMLGELLEQRSDFAEAAKAFQKAVELSPDREEYRIRLALEFAQHQTFEPAIAVLQESERRFPLSAKSRALLGVLLFATRQVGDALTELTEAVRLDPSLAGAWETLATVVLDSTAAPAQSTIDLICTRDETLCGAVELRLSRARDDPELRKSAINKLRRSPKDNPVGRCELGRAYEWSGDWSPARREMEACVRLQPSAQNHYRLGLIYSALELPELAREQMRLRSEATAATADENARRASAIQAFEYVLKPPAAQLR